MEEGVEPPGFELFLSALELCKERSCMHDAMRMFTCMQRCGLETHETLGNYIVPLLAEVGNLGDAKKVFNKLAFRNEYSWNSIISGLVQYEDPHHALILYPKMYEDSVNLSGFTFVALLRACLNLKDAQRGEELHVEIARFGLGRNLFVVSTLVAMYMNCGLFMKALEAFDQLTQRDVISWNALIGGFCKLGFFHEAYLWYREMQLEYCLPNQVTYIFLFRVVTGLEVIQIGQELHAEIVMKGVMETNGDVGNELIEMYANSGLFADAESVCGKLLFRNTMTWTALIAGYCKYRLFEAAISCLKQMQMDGIAPCCVTYINILKACGAVVDMGQGIHADIVKKGLLENNLVSTALIDMYGTIGMVSEAQNLFDNLCSRDVVSWTALIAGYSKYGYLKEAADSFFAMVEENVPPDIMSWNALLEGFAKNGFGEIVLECLEQMQSKGIQPDALTFLFSLKACCNLVAKNKGRELHMEITKTGYLESNLVIGNALVDFYATVGWLDEAEIVLHTLPVQDVVSWTSLMAGYTRHDLGHEALHLFNKMLSHNVVPNIVTFVCGVKACSLAVNLLKGQELHAEIEKKGLLSFDAVGNALVDMYASWGWLAESQGVFNKLQFKDTITWTTLIAGYAKHGLSDKAICCFEEMKSKGVVPDAVSWSALITGYAMSNAPKEVMKCLEEMKSADICPDSVTYVSSLKVCGTAQTVWMGQQIHKEIVVLGLSDKSIVVGNALLDIYATSGLLLEALAVFDKLLHRDAVSWTSLIAGYTKHGYGEEAIDCFEQMQLQGFLPDEVTFVCVLRACGMEGATQTGHTISETLIRSGVLEKNILLCNSLLNMYIDCGLLKNASEIFNKFLKQDVSSWTTMMAGYAKYGFTEKALKCFEKMESAGISPKIPSWNALLVGYACSGDCENAFHAFTRMNVEGIDPNNDTFTGILTACSHGGLVDLGHLYFRAMSSCFVIFPIIEHHICMVDLLGRAGQLDNAVTFVNQMPYHPTLVVWHAILGACRKWSDLEVAQQAYKHAVQLNAKDIGTYVCMFNIYADAGFYRCSGDL
ncbi:hypothetical protein KP509_07G042700 [Ceratopteris richardii]|nr:hypothetical protein KP509_07G042700 [Ceratopteris richardii]